MLITVCFHYINQNCLMHFLASTITYECENWGFAKCLKLEIYYFNNLEHTLDSKVLLFTLCRGFKVKNSISP